MGLRVTGGFVWSLSMVAVVGCGQSSSGTPGGGDAGQTSNAAGNGQGGHDGHDGVTGGAGSTSLAGRVGDGGAGVGGGGRPDTAGQAGSGGSGGKPGSGVGGVSGSAGAGGSAGSPVVDEYPQPLPTHARYTEGGINADPGVRSHVVTQPETSASHGLWLVSSSLQFFASSLQLRNAFWVGEVKNFGAEPVCDVTIKVAFRQDHVDVEPRHETSAKLEGEQRVTQDGQRVWCVLPGTIVPAYAAPQIANDVFGAKMDVATVTWQIDGASDAKVDPLIPTVLVEKLTGQNDEWGLQVQLKGSEAGATQMLLHSTYIGFGDFLEFPMTTAHPGPLAAGEAWDFFDGSVKGPANVKARFRSSLAFAPSP